MTLSYVLPIRTSRPAPAELCEYIRWLSAHADVIVVDGSPSDVFAAHSHRWAETVTHIPVDEDVRGMINGKVAGVITGVRRAAHDRIVIADDDVRYGRGALLAMEAALDGADVVRPQNYFDPLPWHALVDTARTLLNRVTGGDWPGTLGVRRSLLLETGGYDGDVLFENLELVRTVQAAGGTEARPLGLYVRRLPPTTEHFWSQRVRQAYDEFARPWRLTVWLAIAPAVVGLAAAAEWRVLAAAMLSVTGAAEAGRRRAGGRHFFPAVAALVAPLWVVERAICAWIALGAYLVLGGIPYRGRIIARAATPMPLLQARWRS